MNILEAKIGNLSPRYLAKYDPIVQSVTQFGGGADSDRYITGKSFSNAYELYIYCFFLGLSSGESYTVLKEDEMKSFWELSNWKPTELRDQLLACAIAKSDFDMFRTQFMDESEMQVEVRKLRLVIEGYANAGFSIIAESFLDDPALNEDDYFFLSQLNRFNHG